MANHILNHKILVKRGGQQLGPYSLDDARSSLAAGQLAYSDMAKVEGTDDWQSLASVLGVPPPPPPPRVPLQKRLGFHVFLFIFLPFVQVPLMWFMGLFTRRARIAVTVGGVFWFFLLFLGDSIPKHHLERHKAEQPKDLSSSPDQPHARTPYQVGYVMGYALFAEAKRQGPRSQLPELARFMFAGDIPRKQGWGDAEFPEFYRGFLKAYDDKYK